MNSRYYSLYECFEMLADADVAALTADSASIEAEVGRLATTASFEDACYPIGAPSVSETRARKLPATLIIPSSLEPV
jgi:hypothetical protein